MQNKYASLRCKLAFLLLVLFSGMVNAQSYWMRHAGGSTIDEAYGISTDATGNTYTTGYFSGSAAFGSTNLICTGISDAFVCKTDPSGNVLWAVQGGGANSCRGLAIKADAAGNSYVTGFYYNSVTFGGKTITSAGAQDVFIAKYDANGNIVWLASAGGTMADIGNAITVDNSGNVIVTGEFAGSATFGSTVLVSKNNNVNVFTTELDANGNFLWAKSGIGIHTDRGLGVGADGSGNVYVMGQFSDTITFGSIHNTTTNDAVFLLKYNSSGQEQWFAYAGGGTLNIANGIAVDNSGNSYLTGNFTGTMSFFGSPTTTLSPPYANGIFVAKYNSSGTLQWKTADGSSSNVTANAIALDATGNAYVIGNFECRMSSYANQYGQGTFNSVGTWDIFVAEYETNKGAWQWSRQIGGHQDNLGYSIAVDGLGDVYTAGSFNQDMVITTDASFIGYNASPVTCNLAYCSDNNYGSFNYFSTFGNSDIFIAKPIDLSRQPYDFYIRDSATCVRPVVGVSITGGVHDTITFCQSGVLTANSNTCAQVGPNFNYVWSTGTNGQNTVVTKSGWYYVTETSVDGCLQSKDSMYVVINPDPVQPNLSDNVIINTNSTNPQPIIVCDKPVILTGGNYGTNTYSWSGGSTATTVSITVKNSGTYCFNVKNANGCTASVCVSVTIQDSLDTIKPGIKCINCLHDSVAFCRGSNFQLFAFDSITNPAGSTSLCIPPGGSYVKNIWSVTPGTISYAGTTNCPPNSFTPSDSGIWYHITDTIKQANKCDTLISVVKDSVYVTLFPIPTLNPLKLSPASASVCPGDTVLLTASGITPGTGFHWSNGSTADSMWVGLGSYNISEKVVNSYGCVASASASASVVAKTTPSISVTPTTGTICPGDSVALTCNGIGNYSWQGPTGPVGGNNATIYVTTPGQYYCVVTDSNLYCSSILSNTALIGGYSTPQLVALPSKAICPGDSVRISIVGSAGSVIVWLPPLTGSDSVQYISKPGTYSCSVTSCGVTTPCSITITKDNPQTSITASGPQTFCVGDSVSLTANAGMTSYIWNPGGLSGQTVVIKNSGTYTLIATDSNSCKAKDTATVVVTPNNTKPPAVSDTNVCPGTVAKLTVNGNNITWYSTSTGGAAIASGNTYTTPVISGFTVYYISDELGGCVSPRATLNVDTTDCNGTYFPNVFTPNGDGENDVFKVEVKGATCFHGEIFNRWGVKIFEWGDELGGWDGIVMQTHKLAADGVYYYIVNYCDYLGHPGKKEGFVQLIK